MAGDAFGLLLRRYRILHSFTQEALAERAGISPTTIAALERGRRQAPRPSTVGELARALGLDEEERARLIAAASGLGDDTGDDRHEAMGGQADPGSDAGNPLGGALPVVPTPMIGRLGDVETVAREVLNEPLVTLIGSGGVGKSRLALAVAETVTDKFPGGVRWVDLGPLSDPDLVADTVLAALDATGVAATSVLDGITAALAGAKVLLILDGCEHLRQPVSELVAAVRIRTPIHVLATSRRPLHLAGEVCWRVPPLTCPDPATVTGDTLTNFDAAALFVERATRHEPTFVIDDETAVAVAGICRRLDGSPLAIELAAGRVRLFSTKQLVRELDDRFEMLVARDIALPMRHSSLLASVEWGWSLLDEVEQVVLCGLSAFPGSFTLGAAEHVAAATARHGGRQASRWDLLDAIAGLVDRSMVIRLDVSRDPQYHLTETMRAYAARRAAAAGLAEVAAGALAELRA